MGFFKVLLVLLKRLSHPFDHTVIFACVLGLLSLLCHPITRVPVNFQIFQYCDVDKRLMMRLRSEAKSKQARCELIYNFLHLAMCRLKFFTPFRDEGLSFLATAISEIEAVGFISGAA